MWIKHEDPMPLRAPWQRDNQYDAWYSMVTNYNTRALSYETDALAALAGLSSAMATTHGCTYYAGLWKEDLQTGLCWYITGRAYANADAQVASKESFPSWTWISKRGRAIRFCGWQNNHTVVEREGISLFEHHTNRVPKSDSPFTTITPRALMLTGRLRKVAVEKMSGPDYNDKSYGDLPDALWVWRARDLKTNAKLGHIAFDFDPASFKTRDIHCLLCIAREKYDEWQLACLGLVPTDETLEEFKRIGLIVLRQADWFGELRLEDPYDNDARYYSRLFQKDIRFDRTIRLV